MIFYLTFNDAPSGIYSSQVIDVLECLNTRTTTSIKLISFISIRNYAKNRKNIRKQFSSAVVLPMVPFLKNWRLNRYSLFILCLLYKPEVIIARSIFAANLAIFAKSNKLIEKVCYDGRGAIAAEWNEYKLCEQIILKDSISKLEENALMKTDFAIAVSRQLVTHWQQLYTYRSEKYVVIPCTLNSKIFNSTALSMKLDEQKKLLGYAAEDIVMIYSGSAAAWQSLDMLKQKLPLFLEINPFIKILFLIPDETIIQELNAQFPDRIQCKWVDHQQVQKYLTIGDYGFLIREKTITNKVSSPVKFAEYLACGLSVIISEELGDYTEFTKKNKCGYILNNLDDFMQKKLQPISLEQRTRNKELAKLYFNKYSEINLSKYDELLKNL